MSLVKVYMLKESKSFVKILSTTQIFKSLKMSHTREVFECLVIWVYRAEFLLLLDRNDLLKELNALSKWILMKDLYCLLLRIMLD